MKYKSNPCHPLYYKSCSLMIFVSIQAIQDKITLEIVSINKSNIRVNHKHQITPRASLTVIFGGFIHHLEPCWNKMFSLRARQFIICSRCRLHTVCPLCTRFLTPNLHLVITLLLGMNKVLSTTAISSAKAELPGSEEQHFPGNPFTASHCCREWFLLAAHRRNGGTSDDIMPHYTPSSSSSISSPHAATGCVAFPYYPLS